MSVKSVKRKVKAVWYLTIAASLVVAPRRKGFLAHFDLPRWIIFIQQHRPVRLHRLLSILSSFLNWKDMIRLRRIFNKKGCFPLLAFDQKDVEQFFSLFFRISSINTLDAQNKFAEERFLCHLHFGAFKTRMFLYRHEYVLLYLLVK